MKQILKSIALGIFVVLILWSLATNFIQALKCPKMTQTELFLHLPKSFILNWDKCQ